jgi:D-arabinose 1-dehydrogenase-like Zn-dependent alcohol dehydrogenase
MTTISLTAPTPQTTTARAVGTFAPDGPLGQLEIERRALGPKDVRIDIKFCGICHSDIHFARGEWGEVPYPAVPGHEIAGVVAEVGSGVTNFAPGDRVGVGCMVNSCRECENCVAGNEQYCLAGNTQTYGSVDRDGTITYGGYSEHVVVDQTSSSAFRRASSLTLRRLCCVPGSRPTRRCATGAPVPASMSGSSALAVWATWR